jgi:hypothetical protein
MTWSRDSAVGVATGFRSDGGRVRFRVLAGSVLFATTIIPRLRPNPASYPEDTRCSSGLRRLDHEADYSPPANDVSFLGFPGSISHSAPYTARQEIALPLFPESFNRFFFKWVRVRVRVRVTLRLTVCQSVRLGVEPTLGLTTRCYFHLEVWCLKFSVLSLFGRPLWREVGSVIYQSKSVVVCQGKIHIYIFCIINISNMYIQYIQGLLQSQLGTKDYALLFTSSSCYTAVQTLKRSYTWPPPSLSLLYFLCRASPCPI